MDIDGVANHLEGGDRTSLLIFGMRLADIWQIKRGINLLGGHRELGRVHDDITVAMPLNEGGTLYLVAFPLNDMIILSLRTLALQAFLEGMKLDNGMLFGCLVVRIIRIVGGIMNIPGANVCHLWQSVASLNAFTFGKETSYLKGCPLPHSIVEKVGRCVN